MSILLCFLFVFLFFSFFPLSLRKFLIVASRTNLLLSKRPILATLIAIVLAFVMENPSKKPRLKCSSTVKEVRNLTYS